MKKSYDLYKQWNIIGHYEETNLKGAHCEIHMPLLRRKGLPKEALGIGDPQEQVGGRVNR